MQIKETITGTEPISATEAKSWLKVDFSTDDTLIGMLITAVREAAEKYTGLSLIAKTIEYFDEAPDSIVKLPFPEHLEITEVKINNVVTTGYLKTGLTQFIIDISPVFQSSTDNDNGLYVKYKTTGTCPTGLKALMLKEIDEQYRNRGNTFEGAIVDLSANFYASAAKYCLM